MPSIIRVLAVGDPAVSAYSDPRYSIIDTYNKTKDMDVHFEIVPWVDYYGRMMEAFGGKENFDIVMVAGHLWLKDFINKGYIAEVIYPNDPPYNTDDIMKEIRNEMAYEGKPYLYPSFCDGHILLYRKSLAEKVFGGELPDVIDTDTVLLLAEKLHGKDGMSSISMKAHESEIFLDFLPFLRNEGIDAFDSETFLPAFNQEKGVRALEKYLSLKKFAPEDVHTYGNDEVREAFQEKRSAMVITWGGQLGFVMDDRCLEKEDVGFAMIPTAWNVTWGFAINKKSANKELANAFLGYLTSSSIDRMVGRYSGAPVRASSYDTADHAWYPILQESISRYAKPLPKMDDAGVKMAPLYTHIHQAFIGKESPAEALKAAENEILKFMSGRKTL